MECAGEESDPIIIAVVGQDPFEGNFKNILEKSFAVAKLKSLALILVGMKLKLRRSVTSSTLAIVPYCGRKKSRPVQAI